MKIYLAAPWSEREHMRKIAAELHEIGHKITSRWLQDEHTQGTHEQCAQIDLDDIDNANALALFSVGPRGTPFTGGGRCIEFGYALAKRKLLYLIGPQENVFHSFAFVAKFIDYDDFFLVMKHANAGN